VSPPTFPSRSGGLTLIETVVTVGLLSSAAALLVPTLGQTREDAKRLTCLSRLSQVNRALLSYHADLEAFPLFTTTPPSWCSWSFGGWSGRNRALWEGYWSPFNIETNKRPLTVYMTPWEIPDEVDPYTPTQEMPQFQCPSDDISAEWQWGDNDLVAGLSAYDDVGTSYQMNWAWWDQVVSEPCPPDEASPCWPYKVNVLGAQIYEKYLARNERPITGGGAAEPGGAEATSRSGAQKRWGGPLPTYERSRFITLMEDPAFYGLMGSGGTGGSGIQTMGFHGELSTHVVAYSDGGVEYLYLDTRHLHDVPPIPPAPYHNQFAANGHWTACDQSKEHRSSGWH